MLDLLLESDFYYQIILLESDLYNSYMRSAFVLHAICM